MHRSQAIKQTQFVEQFPPKGIHDQIARGSCIQKGSWFSRSWSSAGDSILPGKISNTSDPSGTADLLGIQAAILPKRFMIVYTHAK